MSHKYLEQKEERGEEEPPELWRVNQKEVKDCQDDDSKYRTYEGSFQLSEDPGDRSLIRKPEAVFDNVVGVVVKRELDNREEQLDGEDKHEEAQIRVL